MVFLSHSHMSLRLLPPSSAATQRSPMVTWDALPLFAIATIRYSLAGQDTRLSPERPGFESRWRNFFGDQVPVWFCCALCFLLLLWIWVFGGPSAPDQV